MGFSSSLSSTVISISAICLCIYTHSFRSFALMYNTHSFGFSFYPHSPSLFSIKVIGCCFASCHSASPAAHLPRYLFLSFSFFLPLPVLAPSLSFVSCSHSHSVFLPLFLFLPHNTPIHPRDQACLLCLFHISALCSCDGNLSFKYLFLPSPDFFFPPPSRFSCCHWCTPHSIPEILTVLCPTWLLGTLRLATFNSHLHIET